MTYIPHPMHPEGKYRMEDRLYENLSVLPKRIQKDKDVLGLFVGSPGTGKDTLMQQCLYLLDRTITIENIHWSFESYVEFCRNMFKEDKSKGKGVMHSEGRESLSGLSMMSKRTRKYLNFLYENRQMNMFQFIATGDFYDLPKSIVMQRAKFLISVYESGEFDNGFFRFYDAPTMRRLYIMGKKTRSMSVVSPTFNGRFPRFYCVDEKAYREKKKQMLINTTDTYLKQKKDEITQKQWLYFLWDMNPDIPPSVIINNTPIVATHYFRTKKEWELNQGDISIDY